ncbi:MAG: hypothetical protein ACLFPL_01275 [Candidatus Nanoarchaeia archaeon]
MVQAIINLTEEENKFLNVFKAQRGIKSKNLAIKEMIKEMIEQEQEDLEFAQRTEKAYQAHGRGEFTKMRAKEFVKHLESMIKDED